MNIQMTPRAAPPGYRMAVLAGLAVAAFHHINGRGLADSVLLDSFNWAFDYDSSRFIGGWCTPGAGAARSLGLADVARHALTLATRPLCLALVPVAGGPGPALMALTAIVAGVAAALAYLLAGRFVASTVDRVLLTLGFALSTQPLMLGVLPESFCFALAGIGFHLWLVSNRLDAPKRPDWPVVVSACINAGVTVTNAVLSVISSAVIAWKRVALGTWLKWEARTWLLVVAMLLLIVVPLAALFAPAVLSNAGRAPKAVWWVININRAEAAGLWQVLVTFGLYGFVAPEITIVPLPPPDDHPMLDFREFRYGAWGLFALALWCAGCLVGVRRAWCERSQRDSVRRLCAIVFIWLLANVVLHWYWQYRGSVFLYGAHTAFPLFSLFVLGYDQIVRTYGAALARSAATALVAATAFNNLPIYFAAIDFLDKHPK